MKEKEYFSKSADSVGGTTVYGRKFVDGNVVTYELAERQDIHNHSPDGFSWGYSGSGPAQLALGILADYFDDEFASRHYQSFKREVVSRQPDDQSLVILESEIITWVNNNNIDVRDGRILR